MRDELPYRVINLLPVFEASDTFPLFWATDPHWNVAGARLVAQGVMDELIDKGLIPLYSSRPMAPTDAQLPETTARE